MGTVCLSTSGMSTSRQNSCPSISQLSPFRPSLGAGTRLLSLQSVDLNNKDNGGFGSNLPLYRTVSTGSIAQRKSSDSNSLAGYLEEMKLIKKENLDLKLKVYFLEERLGIEVGGKSMQEMSNENVDLKIQLHQCKVELENKNALIEEAIEAIDVCEKKTTQLEEQNGELIDRLVELSSKEASQKFRDISSQTVSIEASTDFFLDDEYEDIDTLGSQLEFSPFKDKTDDSFIVDQTVSKYKDRQTDIKHNDETKRTNLWQRRLLWSAGCFLFGAFLLGQKITRALTILEIFHNVLLMTPADYSNILQVNHSLIMNYL